MKDYKQLLKELPSSTVVCAMGEFDPPTVGHEILVKTVKRLAEEKSSAHVIFTHPAKNGILQEDKKSQYLSLMFPKTNFKSLDESFAGAVADLKKKYKNVIVVAGTDQMNSLKRGLKESVEFIAIAEKDPDANETKMKSFATKALFEEFKKKLPTTIRELDGKRLMNDVRQGMGLEPIKEQLKLVKDELREQYFRGEIFNVGDVVESAGQQYEIIKRGSNHLLLKDEAGKLTSKWIHDVTVLEHMHTHQHTQVSHNDDHKEISHGDAFSLKIHKDHHQNIFDLEHGQHHEFKCMDGKEWHAVRHGDDIHFVAHPDDVRIHANYHPKIPHAQFTGNEEYNEPERPTFHTVFANGDTMVKEGVIQPNGTDKVETNQPDKADSKDQNGNPMPRSQGKTKGYLTFYGYTKDQNDFKVAKMEQTLPQSKSDIDKDNESDYDAIAQDPLRYDPSVVGHTLVSQKDPKGSHHLRRRKVDYAFREEKKKDSSKVLPHDKEVAHIKNDSCSCGCESCAGGSGQNTVSLRQEDIDIPKDAPSVETIAKKHGVSVAEIEKQLKIGMKVEAEHGKNPGSEREIAMDHLNERPDYYKRLKKFVEQVNETKLNQLDPHGDYKAKSKALQDIQLDPHTHKDPELSAQLIRSKAALEKEYEPHRIKEEIIDEAGYGRNRSYSHGFASPHAPSLGRRGREDDEYHTPDPVKHTYTYTVSKEGGEKHNRTVTTPSTTRPKHELEHLARAHLEKQGYTIHEETELDETKRMSAQVKLQRAFERERAKSDASRRRAENAFQTTPKVQEPTGSPQSQRPFDPFFKEDEEWADTEIDKLIESVTFDDILDLYEEEELTLVYEDTGEEVPVAEEEAEIDLMEMLSRAERFKSKIRFRRSKAKRERSTKIALKRYSPIKTINKRARRLAIKLMKQRLLRGRKYSEVSIGDKERIDKTISKRKATIDRIAAKLIARIRGTEKSRMSHNNVTKADTPNVF